MTTSRAQTLIARLPDRLADFVAPLLAPETMPGARLGPWVRLVVTVTLIVANVVGALVVALVVTLVIPEPSTAFTTHVVLANVVAGTLYIVVAVPIGYVWGLRHFDGLEEWLASNAPPSPHEQRMVLRGPVHLLKVQAVLWLGAVAVFAVLDATFSGPLARNFALTVALGGTTTCAVTYLLSERALRPIAMRVLADGLPERESLPGVSARALLAWGARHGRGGRRPRARRRLRARRRGDDRHRAVGDDPRALADRPRRGRPRDPPRGAGDRRPDPLGLRRPRAGAGRPLRRSRARLRRHRDRPAAVRLQPHVGRPGRARAHPRAVRPPGRRGRRARRARGRHRARRRGARRRGPVRRRHRLDRPGRRPPAAGGRGHHQPLLRRRRAGRRRRGRLDQQVRGRRRARDLRGADRTARCVRRAPSRPPARPRPSSRGSCPSTRPPSACRPASPSPATSGTRSATSTP